MFGVVLPVIAVSLLLAVGTSGVYTSPFILQDNDCPKNCSWSWGGFYPGTQFCDKTTVENRVDVCPNPFIPTNDPAERPPIADNVGVTEYNKVVTELGQGTAPTSEQYTCLNITYSIEATAAEKVKGLQLSILGTTNPDLNKRYCANLNFSSDGLQYNAVLEESSDADGKRRSSILFSFDCFCGLKPSRRYTVTVRTMPVDNQLEDSYDTRVDVNYETIGCDDPAKESKDVRCLNNEEARWYPECILASQNLAAGDYENLEVSFDVAPPGYNFNVYKVFVYEDIQSPPKDHRIVSMPKTVNKTSDCLQSASAAFVVITFNVSLWDLTRNQFQLAIKPSSNTCKDAEGMSSSCKTTYSNVFSIVKNPCGNKPCGEHVNGDCVADEDQYICDCRQGYMLWNSTCVVDPCQVSSDGSNQTYSDPCPNGVCSYTPSRNGYYCNCNENYLLVGMACLPDPCTADPDTKTTVCGQMGECRTNHTADGVISYSCGCQLGYAAQHEGPCKKAPVQIPLIIGVVLASCVAGALLFLLGCYTVRRTRPTVPPPPSVTPPVRPRAKEPRPGMRKKVLPIYSDDHHLHKQVVLHFCRFLQTHCRCDVTLMDWEKSVGPTVEMWLTNKIEEADIVLLLCSKGTRLKYEAKAKLSDLPADDSSGIYGDVFMKALVLLHDYINRNDACEKFIVVYFEYSDKKDIPVTFRNFAQFRLMSSMEELFLMIHGQVKESPMSSQSADLLAEKNYPHLEMGKALQDAIAAMKNLTNNDSNWFGRIVNLFPSRQNNRRLNRNDSCVSEEIFLRNNLEGQEPVFDRMVSNDSAYISLEQNPCSVPSDFFSRRDSGESNRFVESVGPNLSRSGALDYHEVYQPQPETRLFSEDIHLTMTPGQEDEPYSNNYSDIEFGHQGMANRNGNAFGSFV